MTEDENKKNQCLIPMPSFIALSILAIVLNMLSSLPSNALLMPFYTVISASSIALLNSAAKYKYKWLYLLIPFSFLLSIAVTKDAFSSLNSLIAFPLGYMLSAHITKKSDKTKAVVSMTGITLAVWLMIILCQTLPSLAAANNSIITLIKNEIMSIEASQRAILEQIAERYIQQGYGSINIDASISVLMSSIPALAVISVTIVSYLTASLCSVMFGIFGAREKMIPQKWEISLSPISACIYTVSFVLFALLSVSSNGMGMFFALILNITMILMPGFSLVGLKKIFVWLSRFENTSISTLLKVIYVIISIVNIYYSVYITSLTGSVVTVITAFNEMRDRKNR